MTTEKVRFVVAGAQKSGTTALDKYLRLHPQIQMPDKKEVHFFDHERLFKSGSPDYRQYHAYYSPKSEGKLLGDVTPAYMYLDSCMERICRYNPEMKVICILRDPITRAYSHWNMERDLKREKLDFLDAMFQEAERTSENRSKQRKFSYVDRGFYSKQIERIWEHFPKEQTLFIKYEELKNNPNDVLSTIFNFLNVDSLKITEERIGNKRPYKTVLQENERSLLMGIFNKEIEVIENMLGWDLSDWKSI